MKRERVVPLEKVLPIDQGYYDPASRSISEEHLGSRQGVVVLDLIAYRMLKQRVSEWKAVNRRIKKDPEASKKFLGIEPLQVEDPEPSR